MAARRPGPQARTRDPERTQAALLDAAQAEFADKGFAGARVDTIAARAGVNKQLIAYYFTGKQGLYDAVADRRKALVAGFDTAEVTLPELARRYVHAFADNPDLERIYLRDMLDQDPAAIDHAPDAAELVDLVRRQRDGELAGDLDPAFVLLFLQAMTVAGSLLPGEAKRLTGLDPRSPEFRTRTASQLSAVVARLAAARPAGEGSDAATKSNRAGKDSTMS